MSFAALETWWTSEGGSVPEGHSFACEGEAAVEGCPKPGATPSVSLRISAPCYGKAGVSRSAFTRRFI